MPKYIVEVLEVHRNECEIKSKEPMDRAALLAKAKEMIEAGEQITQVDATKHAPFRTYNLINALRGA